MSLQGNRRAGLQTSPTALDCHARRAFFVDVARGPTQLTCVPASWGDAGQWDTGVSGDVCLWTIPYRADGPEAGFTQRLPRTVPWHRADDHRGGPRSSTFLYWISSFANSQPHRWFSWIRRGHTNSLTQGWPWRTVVKGDAPSGRSSVPSICPSKENTQPRVNGQGTGKRKTCRPREAGGQKATKILK